MEKKLYRDTNNKMIGGVCAGLAEYFNVDVSIVRIIFLASLVLGGSGGIIYLIMMIVLPKKPYFINPGVDYRVPPVGDNFNNPEVDYKMLPFAEKKKSNSAVIAGAVLVVMGTVFLINQLGLLPHIGFGKVWPVILIAIGLSVIFSPKKKEPWKEDNWAQAAETTDKEQKNDNPPTV